MSSSRYYRKEIPESPIYIFGKPLKFEILETADASLIAELDKCIAHGRGGVIAISQDEYEAEKKTCQREMRSDSVYKQNRQRLELSSPLFGQHLAVDAANEIRISGAFARPQEREHTPNNQFGLPAGAVGPGNSKAMPDPIELPKAEDMKPPTAKLSEVAAIR